MYQPAIDYHPSRKILTGIVGGFVAAVIAWLVAHREPSFQSKGLSAWVGEIRPGNLVRPDLDHWENFKAYDAIKHIGTNAVPVLLGMIQADDSPFRLKAIAWLNQQPLIRKKYVTAANRRLQAIAALRHLESSIKPWMPQFARLLNDPSPDKAMCAACALEQIGSDAAPYFIDAVTNRHPAVRLFVLGSPHLFGRNPALAVPNLLLLFNGRDPRDHQMSIWVLGELRKCPEKVVPVLIEALSDPDRNCRAGAMEGLRKFGSYGDLATPEVVKTLEDPDPYVRKEAAKLLRLIAPKIAARHAIPVLVKDLEKEDQFFRAEAADILGDFGAEAKSAEPSLLAALFDESGSMPILSRDSHFPPFAAIDALSKIGADELSHGLSVLAANLRYTNSIVRINAADTLEHLKFKSRPAASALIAAAADPDGHVRNAAARALLESAPEDISKILPSLIENLQNHDNLVRFHTIILLDRIGAPAKSAIPALLDSLHDWKRGLRRDVARALVHIDPDSAKLAFPILMEQLHDKDPIVQQYAAQSLGELKEYAREAIPALLETLKTLNSDRSGYVNWALINIAPETFSYDQLEMLRGDVKLRR